MLIIFTARKFFKELQILLTGSSNETIDSRENRNKAQDKRQSIWRRLESRAVKIKNKMKQTDWAIENKANEKCEKYNFFF